MSFELENASDEVAELLDDLAYLGGFWAKCREKGKAPPGVRQELISLSKEVSVAAEISEISIDEIRMKDSLLHRPRPPKQPKNDRNLTGN